MERFAEHVRFEHDLTERFIRVRTSRPNRIVAFSKRSEQVRECLERRHDALPHREREPEPTTEDKETQRPLHFGGVVSPPNENHGNDHTRKPRGER